MISNFDMTKLKLLLKDFYNITKIRITVFDDSFHELAAYPDQLAPLCQMIRSDAGAAARCHHCDAQACEIAAKRRTLYTYRCHAGLTESITPIIIGNIIIGYLLFGHVFSYASHEEGWEQIQKFCEGYSVDRKKLETICRKQEIITEDYISSASHIMQAVASYLCMDRMVTLRQQELPVQIDKYIQSHFAENIDALQLTKEFGIGKTQLYKIANQNYGMGIAAYIRSLRIEKAQQLLSEQSDLSLAEIADACGFDDYNYFITVFRRTVGVPPKAYANSTGRIKNTGVSPQMEHKTTYQ